MPDKTPTRRSGGHSGTPDPANAAQSAPQRCEHRDLAIATWDTTARQCLECGVWTQPKPEGSCRHWMTTRSMCDQHETCADCGHHLPLGWADLDEQERQTWA